jgi:hypothetical protein
MVSHNHSSVNENIKGRDVVLGDLVVAAIGPNVRGFKPGRGRWIFKGDKNP